jgi:hypothetical protein
MEAIAIGRMNNKLAARDAYDYFSGVLKYRPDDRNAQSLRNEAEELGITHVLIKLENQSNQILPSRMQDELLAFQNTGRQSQWKKFYTNPQAVSNFDFISRVVVNHLQVSPEQVRETIHHFYREINETQYARDVNGRILRDSLGNKIEILVPREVRAEVFEISQNKEAIVEMTIEVLDHTGSNVLRRERMQAVGNFDNDACRIQGDRRAVEGRWLNLGEPLPFPSNESLILIAAEELKNQVTDYLVKYPFDRV